MTVYNDVLKAVIGLMNESKPYSTIYVGSAVPRNGISVLPNPASPNAFLDKNAVVEWIIALNGKNENQMIVFETLNMIHLSLTRRKKYPSSINFQIYDIDTIGSPRLIGREGNDQWIYGSLLRIKFYMRGD